MTVRTRFAPSPTGYLHIGGVRTALFNWLFSRQRGGQFLLRIDDTDQQRNIAAALQPILDGFRWLGIDWDEGPEVGGPHAPYFQSQRHAAHSAAVARLLEAGHAYRDFATTEEIQAERTAAEKDKRSFLYSRKWLAATDADVRRFTAEGRKGVVRLKMPREGQCRFHDLVRGDVAFDWANEQDHVVQRADGTCLYHLASAVDDHDFRITHVIRAIEHLSNTPRQIFIMQGLGYELPEFAHLPYVAEPGSQNKLSKRKIAQYLKHADDVRLSGLTELVLKDMGIDARTGPPIDKVVALLKDRANTIVHLAENARMFYTYEQPMQRDIETQIDTKMRPALQMLKAKLAEVRWERKSIAAAIAEVLKANAMKMPELAMPVRLLVTGRTQTPSLDAVLELLGRDTVLQRLVV